MAKRNQYSKEFRASAVKLVLDDGRSVTTVGESLGVKPNSVQKWVQQARVDRGEGRGEQLTTDENLELTMLRKRVKELETDKAILKKSCGPLRQGERVRFALIDVGRDQWERRGRRGRAHLRAPNARYRMRPRRFQTARAASALVGAA